MLGHTRILKIVEGCAVIQDLAPPYDRAAIDLFILVLAIGDKLGHYEVLSLLGQGGMGEVYKARDLTLKRDVALKVLPAAFLRDHERMARFQREAEVLASLDHPNIGHIHGIVDWEDSRGLVLALIEGPTLADHIEAGPIPLDEAIAMAKQIVEALEYAHDRGVIHRDLKPANVKITPEGVVKVLDFGLAKVLEDEPQASSLLNSPTLTMGRTRAGMILGTAAYMSPEQAVGRPVDRRSDIFSFGTVLYEMLTGKRAFSGAATPDVLEAVVKNEPDWSELPSGTPEYLRRMLERTLAKDRKQRLQAIGEARIALECGNKDPAARGGKIGLERSTRSKWALWTVAGLAVAVTVLGLMYLRLKFGLEPQPVMRVQILTPDGAPAESAQISPDGGALAIVTEGGLWLRPLNSLEARLFPATEGAHYPFWSPDSRNIGFFQHGKLKRLAVEGGPAVDVCNAIDGRGGTWNQENVIVFAPGPSTGLYRVSAGAGTPEIVVKPTQSATEENIRYPWFLPDGQHFLYQHSSGSSDSRGIYLGALDGEVPIKLRPGLTNAVYAPANGTAKTGLLLFRIGETLMGQPFDLNALRLSGEMSPVADRVGESGNIGNGAFSVSLGGILVYGAGAGERQESRMTWLDRTGKAIGTPGPLVELGTARISPNAKQLVYSARAGGRWSLYVQQTAGGPSTQISSGADRNAGSPVWSPDATRVVFSKLGPRSDLFLKYLGGDAQEESLGVGALNAAATDWSADGKWIAYGVDNEKTSRDLWLLPISGDRKPIVFLQTAAREDSARFSPDGRWMAYAQEEAGRYEVFVQAISPAGPATGIKYRVSSAGGTNPFWRRDGKELYFQAPDQVMAAAVTLGATFHAGDADKVFNIPSGAVVGQPTPDRQRYLAGIAEGGSITPNALKLVLNWQAGLKK